MEGETSAVSLVDGPCSATKKKKRHIDVDLTAMVAPLADNSVPFKLDKDSISDKVVVNSIGLYAISVNSILTCILKKLF